MIQLSEAYKEHDISGHCSHFAWTFIVENQLSMKALRTADGLAPVSQDW